MWTSPNTIWSTAAQLGFALAVFGASATAAPKGPADKTAQSAAAPGLQAPAFTPSTKDELANIDQPVLRERLLQMAQADQVARSTGT